jgi:hypothetical protein
LAVGFDSVLALVCSVVTAAGGAAGGAGNWVVAVAGDDETDEIAVFRDLAVVVGVLL